MLGAGCFAATACSVVSLDLAVVLGFFCLESLTALFVGPRLGVGVLSRSIAGGDDLIVSYPSSVQLATMLKICSKTVDLIFDTLPQARWFIRELISDATQLVGAGIDPNYAWRRNWLGTKSFYKAEIAEVRFFSS